MKVRAFGYAREQLSKEGLLEMREVAFVGSPTELKRIAAFLVKSADEIEQRGAKFSHNHLQDEDDLRPWFDEGVDVIVARGDLATDEKPA
jgi:hypothetical protein